MFLKIINYRDPSNTKKVIYIPKLDLSMSRVSIGIFRSTILAKATERLAKFVFMHFK